MKRTTAKALLMGAALLTFVCSPAFATTIVIPDTMIAFPGYEDPLHPTDQIGHPAVGTMTITIGDQRELQSVALDVTNRVYFDTLFLNLALQPGEDWDQWDYLVRTEVLGWGNSNSPLENGLYAVDPGYSYVLAAYGRTGHPADIAIGDVTLTGIPYGTSYDGSVLTYDFTGSGFVLGDRFAVAYAPWCANDVTGNPVPEPGAFLLLGTGLIGLAIVRRKAKSRTHVG